MMPDTGRGDGAMVAKREIVRLIASCVACTVSCIFVSNYNEASILSQPSSEQGRLLPELTRFVILNSAWAYCVPAVILVIGIVLLRQKIERLVAFEILVSLGWLLALSWALGAIVAWQVSHIEMYSGPH